jgi:integrator complex subunit 10
VFPREAQLQSCLTGLVEALLTPPTSDDPQEKVTAQKKLLFNQLPANVQKSVLLHAAADENSGVLRQCKVWLVIIKLFPDTVKTLGLDAYDLLSKESSTAVMADNQSRELLVCEVIPLLLASPEIRLELPVVRSSGQSTTLKTSHLCQWLESVASFYTTVTSQALLCGRGHKCAGKVGWDQLHQLLMRTAEKCGWREVILSNQIGPHLPSRVRWLGVEKLSGYNPHVKPFEAPRPVAIACFYIAVFLFFEMAWDYCSEMLAPAFGGSSVPVAGRAPWLVVEEYQHHPTSLDDKTSKRRKTDDSRPSLNFNTGSRSVDQKMVERFMVATDCWDFLQSNVTYQQEFMRLGQQWGALEWSWLGMFRADMAVFKCDHTLGMQILTHEWHKVSEDKKTSPMATRIIMQMVNCAMVLGDSRGACSFASEVVSLLPSSQVLPGVSSPRTLPPIHTSGRQLRLLCCTPDEIMPFCMEVIIRTLKDVAFGDPKNERALGQLLVLLQYQWPKEEEIFASLITTIQKRRRFHFPEFFDYVIRIHLDPAIIGERSEPP